MKRDVPLQNIPVRSELGKQIRRAFKSDAHRLAEIDDNGGWVMSRSFRYVCWCGKTGTWQPSAVAARGDHGVHRSEAPQ